MRIAVLGLGFMGSTHLKAWRNVPGAELAAVYSSDKKKLSGDLSEIQGNIGGPGERYDFSSIRKYEDIGQLLADPGIDAVDVCLPTDLHTSTTLDALRAGKHVLVEKPMALTGALADEMIAEAKRNGRVLMTAQVLRFFPTYRVLADALRSGKYGPVRSAILRRRCAAPFWSKWLGERSKSGGGVFDLLIHDIDMCLMLFGAPEAVSATGYEDLDAGIDIIHATLHYRDVPSVVITGGWHHKKAYPFSMEYTVAAQEATFEYSSTKGNSVTIYGADGEAREADVPGEDAFEAELRYFTECVTQGRENTLCPPEDSAKAVKAGLLMLEARGRSGEKVPCTL